MKLTLSPAKAKYLERVAAGLADLSGEDRDDVIQDLEAHLVELEDDQMVRTLGDAEEFVTEFRASAGLTDRDSPPDVSRLMVVRARLGNWGQRLSSMTNWGTIRPVWVWTRGWLLIAGLAVLSQSTPFQHFPIPTIEGSLLGLLLVAGATYLSVALDRGRTPVRQFSSVVFSAAAVVIMLTGVVAGPPLSSSGHGEIADGAMLQPGQLIGADGGEVTNIYAFDREGNSVEVLLFDQNGNPLQSLPAWVYEEAERNPGFDEPFEVGPFAVRFARDEFGRPVTNLYPLTTLQFGADGWMPLPPPQLGFPRVGGGPSGEDAITNDGAIVTTTSMPELEGLSD